MSKISLGILCGIIIILLLYNTVEVNRNGMVLNKRTVGDKKVLVVESIRFNSFLNKKHYCWLQGSFIDSVEIGDIVKLEPYLCVDTINKLKELGN